MILRTDLIKIGSFGKPHGIHGEISLRFTDDIFDRSSGNYIVCEMEGIFVPFFIEEYRFKGAETALLKLQDIDSESDARPFTHQEVYFPKSFLSEEEEAFEAPGDFFIGYRVLDDESKFLGTIVDIEDSTINTLFVVETEDGDELLLPANDDFVVEINQQKREITLSLPVGLTDM